MYAEICFMVYLVRSSHINYNNGTLQRGLCKVYGALGVFNLLMLGEKIKILCAPYPSFGDGIF